MPKEIIELKVDEVSMVDNPANKKKFLVVKRQEDDDVNKRTLDDVLSSKEARREMWTAVNAFHEAVNDTMRDEDLSESEKAEDISASTDQLSSTMNNIAPDLAKKLDVEEMEKRAKEKLSNKGGGNMPDVKELLEKIEDEELRKNLSTQIESLEDRIAKLEEPGDDGNDGEEDIDKAALPEDVRKRFEEMENKAKKAEDIAKKERQKRLDVEFRKRAKSYKDVADVEKVTDILKKAAGLDNEFCETVEEVFKSAQKRIEESDLYKEKGDGGQDTTDAESELEKKAEEIKKNDPDLSEAQAMRKAMEDNRDLYLDYRSQSANE